MSRVAVVLSLLLVLGACTVDTPTAIEFPGGGPTTTTSTSTTTTSTTTTTTIPTAYFNGKVVDETGTPVAGALVSVGGETRATDGDGFVALGPVPITAVQVQRPGWLPAVVPWDGGAATTEAVIEPRLVRALRVSAEVAQDPGRFEELLDLADETAVNALVFDTKQEGGTVLYDTAVQEAHEIGAVKPFYDPVELLALAKARGYYTITRVVSFEDGIRARAMPEEALVSGYPWLDPRDESVWQYPLALAVEACELGFEEIQFDYVRFPTGQAASVSGQRSLTQADRVGAIEAYLAEARSRLHPMGCAVSADIFGIVVSTPDDQGIGQRPEELSRQLDAVSPMVYPSHYSDGWLGFGDPNDYPYEVTADAIDDAMPRLAAGSVLRPWLQAFWWTPAQIKESILAAEDRGVGWILWNAPGNFDRASLPTDAELAERVASTTTTTSTTVPETTTTTVPASTTTVPETTSTVAP